MVRMSVTRTSREGAMDEKAFAAFRELMPIVRSAVQLQSAIGAAAASGMVQAFDATGQAALLLDERGSLILASRAGEAILSQGTLLSVRDARPIAVAAQGSAAFDSAIGAAMAAETPMAVPPEPFLLRSADWRSCLTVEVQPLPRGRELFGPRPAILILLKPGCDEATQLAMLLEDYRLTPAEAEVALSLAQGERPATIARKRGVGLPTVRSQVTAIYAKLHVRGQVELSTFLRNFGSQAGHA